LGKHSLPDPDTLPGTSTSSTRPEPVAIGAAVQAVLAAIVTIGWVQLDDATIATIATLIAGAVSVGITIYTRSKVTPVSDPKLSKE
jgi:hypothetical protein